MFSRTLILACLSSLLLLTGCQSGQISNFESGDDPANDPIVQEVETRRGVGPIAEIATTVKATLSGVDDATLYGMMARHYQTLRLMDANGNWAAPELAAIAERLLPADVTVDDALTLVDDMAAIAKQNTYLRFAVWRASLTQLERLNQKVATEGPYVLPAVVAYAMVQQNLTRALYDDWRLLPVIKTIFVTTRDAMGVMAALDPFRKVKLISVEGPISEVIAFFSAGEVRPDWGELGLPLNINEAVGTDIAQNNPANAKAGVVLAFNKPGEHPANFSENGKSILIHVPEPKLWDDLYGLWNLSFVASYPYFPFVMVKLLIPQVNDYAELPEEYIYNRVLALYVHIHFSIFGRVDQMVSGEPAMDWYDPALIESLGDSSLIAAAHYARTVGWRF